MLAKPGFRDGSCRIGNAGRFRSSSFCMTGLLLKNLIQVTICNYTNLIIWYVSPFWQLTFSSQAATQMWFPQVLPSELQHNLFFSLAKLGRDLELLTSQCSGYCVPEVELVQQMWFASFLLRVYTRLTIRAVAPYSPLQALCAKVGKQVPTPNKVLCVVRLSADTSEGSGDTLWRHAFQQPAVWPAVTSSIAPYWDLCLRESLTLSSRD